MTVGWAEFVWMAALMAFCIAGASSAMPLPRALYGADFTLITDQVEMSGMPPGMPADDQVAVPPAGSRLVGIGEAHKQADVKATSTARRNANFGDARRTRYVFMYDGSSFELIDVYIL